MLLAVSSPYGVDTYHLRVKTIKQTSLNERTYLRLSNLQLIRDIMLKCA